MPHRTRVLVVDDDKDMVDSLVALLETEGGYNAKGIYSARTIVSDVQDFDPDVVIMDVGMPGRSGWDAARDVRHHRPGKRPVLIAISGLYRKDGDRMLSELCGYDYYFVKPFDTKVLLQLVGSFHWLSSRTK